MQYICVFCGSRQGNQPVFREAAADLGRAIASRGYGLVYGGGNVGLMGVVADSVLEAKGPVIGVIPRFMIPKELAHDGLTELRVVDTMHERKAIMAATASAFISLPGGIGTYEECLEQLAWLKLDIHGKPSGLLNVSGYYNPLLAFLQHTVDSGFFDQTDLNHLVVAEEPVALLDRLSIP
jgi:uncharacterized protein (TIGR00730 family)